MDNCKADTPEEEVAIARRALAEGDPKHALHHLAGALAVDPTRPDWLALLDDALDAGDRSLDLVPIRGEPPPFYGTVALHAYLLARLGRLGEAADLLMQIVQGFPQVPYIAWLLAWLDRPELVGRLPMPRVGWFLGRMVQQYPGLKDRHEGGRATLDRLPEFVRKVRATQPPDADVLAVSVSLLRRLGHLDEALEYARAAYALEPGYRSAVAIAVAHESRREPDAALEAYRDALRFEPDDVALRLSMADLLWTYDRVADAEAMYADALRLDPKQPWALPSHLYLSWQRTGDEALRFKLLALADACPDNDRAARMAELATPYRGYLPEPADATTNLFKQMLHEKGDVSGLSSLSLSSLEAPSNYLAFPQLYAMAVTVADLHRPDPRVPRCEVRHILWTYDGTTPRTAVGPPDVAVAGAVAEIAKQRFQIRAWQRSAARLGEQLGPGRIPDLLATMVHPPMPDGVRRLWGWVYRVQVAAALVVAQTEGAWDGSARRAALLSLVWGPMDWTVDAALIALAGVAEDDEPAAGEIADVFRALRGDLPTGGAVGYYPALLWSMLRLPTLDAAERADLRRSLRSWYEVEEDEADVQFRVARMYEKQKDDAAALAAVEKAIELRPDFAEALELRGRLHLWGDRLDQAVADFGRAIDLEPDGAARAFRGEAYRRLRRYDEALADLDVAVRLTPDYAFPWTTRGQVHARLGRHAEAIADFTRALALRPSAFLYNERAGCRYGGRDFAGAITDHEQALGLAPDDPTGCNGLAWILATCPDAALRDGARACELATRACQKTAWAHVGYIDTLACACAEAGRFDDAVKHAGRVVELAAARHKAEYQGRLDLFKTGKPFHTE